MSAPLRLLFLADPSMASRAVGLIEQQSPVAASLATDSNIFGTALRDERWDGVLVLPGSPVLDIEVARIYVESKSAAPLVVVGSKVPDALRQVGASTVALSALGALAALLRTVLAGRIPTVHVPSAPAAPTPQPRPTPHQPPPTPGHPDPEATAPPPPSRPSPPSTTPIEDASVSVASSTIPDLDELATSRDAIETLADHLPVGIYRTTPDGRVLYANPAFAGILEVADAEQATRLDVRWDLGYPRDAFEAGIRDSGEVRNLILTWTTPSGRRVHTRENARVVRTARGRVLYYEGTIEDVTEEIERAARERLRTRLFAAAVQFYDAANSAQTTGELHRDVVHAFQEAFEADWAVIVRPVKGRNRIVVWQGLPDEAVSEMQADELFATTPIPVRTTLLRTVGSVHGLPDTIRDQLVHAGVESFGCFPLLRNGRPLGSIVVGYRQPHTFQPEEVQGGEMLAWHLAGYLARRMAEQSLEDTEATLQFVTEHTGHALYRRRYSGEFDYLSPVIESLTGYTREALIRMGGLEALVVESVMDQGSDVLSGPSSDGEDQCRVLYRIETRSGGTRWIENTASTWRDASGQPVGVVGVLHDVTDRKQRDDAQAEETQRAMSRQAALVDLATVGTGHEILELVMQRAVEQACHATAADQASIWLRDGEIIACQAMHPGRGESIRYKSEAFDAVVQGMAGQRALAIADVETDERAAALGLTAFASAIGASGLLIAPIRQAGEVSGALILHRRGDSQQAADPWAEADIAFVAAVADALALTFEHEEREEAQRALEASETRYRTLAELTSDYAFAVIADEEGHGPIAWATDAFQRISGYTADEIGSTHGLADILHPESRLPVCRAFRSLAETGAVDFEACIMTRDEETRWVHHRARVSEEGLGLVYHSGEDVTERKRFEAELVDARERAEAMGRLKSAFLANMSHEIRTPLTSILGYSDLLLDELVADQRDFVLHIARSGVRLLDTLNSVLDLARIEADGVELQVRPLTVADHVESAIEPYRREAERFGLGFHVDTDPTIQAELDPSCFQRIVTNLVGNAVKFTEAGGVAVQVEADATHVYLHVRDTGVGMDEAFLENLFTDFQQESFGHNRSYEGTGLGMSITKRYVDLLGGTIEVETEKGVGTSFVVSFPLAWSSSAPPSQSSETEDDLEQLLALASRSENAHEQPVEAAIEAISRQMVPTRSVPHIEASPSASGPVGIQQGPEMHDSTSSNTSGLGFETASVSDDTPPAPAAFVSPSPGASQNPDLPVSHDPSLPTDMFFNRPEKAPDAVDVPGEAPAPAPEAATPAQQLSEQPMIVRGPAGEPASPSQEAPAWPPVPSAPASTETPAPAFASPMASPSAAPASPAAPATPPASATEGADDKPTLLVVEDNDDTRMLLDRILRSSYTVTAVGDARSALIEMNRNQFVGLVLDINLGGKETGADILRIARTLDGYTDVFAIALTAYALPGDRERLLEAGFNEYISKPFTRHSLMEALKIGLAS